MVRPLSVLKRAAEEARWKEAAAVDRAEARVYDRRLQRLLAKPAAPEPAAPAAAAQRLPVVYVLDCREMPDVCKVGRASSWAGAYERALHYGRLYGLTLHPVALMTVRDKRAAITLEADIHAYLRHRRFGLDGARELYRFLPIQAAELVALRADELGLLSREKEVVNV